MVGRGDLKRQPSGRSGGGRGLDGRRGQGRAASGSGQASRVACGALAGRARPSTAKVARCLCRLLQRRDWDALRHLIQADAKLVRGRAGGLRLLHHLRGAALGVEAVARAGGRRAVGRDLEEGRWRLASACGDEALVAGRQGRCIKDYSHVDYLLRHAHTEGDEATRS